jgi:hypothetical protein
MTIDGYHLPSGWQRSIVHIPLLQVWVFTDQVGEQAAIIFLPRAIDDEDVVATASAATAATSANFEMDLII